MAIKKTDAYFLSTNKITNIHVNIWCDDVSEPKGLIQIVHGVAEHVGRYDRFARYFADKGYVVFGNDHIGHGLSCEMIMQLGDFGSKDDDIRMVDDLNMLRMIMRKRYPSIPLFVLGHDMGSMLARTYALHFPNDISGLILSGVFTIDEPFTLAQPFVDTVADSIGRDNLASKTNDAFWFLSKKMLGEDDDYAYLSLSKKNRDEATNDPYFGFPITYGSSMNLLKIAMKCSSPEFYVNFNPTVSCMIIGGAKDPIGYLGRDAVKICNKLENAGVEVTVHQYPGLRHEVLNEDDNEYVYDDIYSWISVH